jgi:hypothetical protein
VDKEVHLTLHMPGARTIQIEQTTPDPYASMDAAADRLVRAAKKELLVAEGAVPGGLIEDLPNARATGARPRRKRG